MLVKILILIHVCSATVGLLSGFLAMVFRKGSGLHGAAGSNFPSPCSALRRLKNIVPPTSEQGSTPQPKQSRACHKETAS